MAMPSFKDQPMRQALWRSGLLCRCPNCQKAPLYAGLTKIHKTCRNCDYNLEDEDSGDGPAAALIFIEGLIFIPLVLWVYFQLAPPLWVQFIGWPFVVIATTLALIRPIKSLLITIQYRLAVDNGSITALEKDKTET